MTNEQEIVWLAGLLEGEGCFSLRKNAGRNQRSTCVEIRLCMTDEDVVIRAARILGARRVRKQRRDLRSDNWKITFTTQVGGDRAISIMRAILPFMGNRRKAKIESCLTAYEYRAFVKVSKKRCSRTANLFAVSNAS